MSQSGLVIAPSVLSADFGRLADDVRAVDLEGAEWIHVDVMDGRFVPTITLGPLVVKALRRATEKPLDVHLMIVEPERHIEELARARRGSHRGPRVGLGPPAPHAAGHPRGRLQGLRGAQPPHPRVVDRARARRARPGADDERQPRLRWPALPAHGAAQDRAAEPHDRRARPRRDHRGAGKSLIADYTFAKDALFAGINLKGDELEMYPKVHEALGEKIPKPNLIVYLQATTDTLMSRIAFRDRPYERQMESAYIDELNMAYEDFFSKPYDHTPVLKIDTNDLNIIQNVEHIKLIEKRIRESLGLSPYQPALPMK